MEFRLNAMQRSCLAMGKMGLICFFVWCGLSVVPLIDGAMISWDKSGLILVTCLMITIIYGAIEFLQPAPQETVQAVDRVIALFEKRLNDLTIPTQQWTATPYGVPPPAQRTPMPTQQIPVSQQQYPLNAWQPAHTNMPTQQVPVVRPVQHTPTTTQQNPIILNPHHFNQQGGHRDYAIH